MSKRRLSIYSPGSLLLLEAGITLGEIAKILDRDISTVSRWVSGEKKPRPEFFRVVEATVGADIASQLKELMQVPA